MKILTDAQEKTMKDLTPSTTTATTDTAPFVRVLIDKATGRTIVALDADAAHALSALLDGLDLHGMAKDPGYHGLDKDDADAQSLVGGLVRSGLAKLYR